MARWQPTPGWRSGEEQTLQQVDVVNGVALADRPVKPRLIPRSWICPCQHRQTFENMPFPGIEVAPAEQAHRVGDNPEDAGSQDRADNIGDPLGRRHKLLLQGRNEARHHTLPAPPCRPGRHGDSTRTLTPELLASIQALTA